VLQMQHPWKTDMSQEITLYTLMHKVQWECFIWVIVFDFIST